MNRTRINYVTDAIALAGFLFLISTGILLRYSLPPGSGGAHGPSLGQASHSKPVSVLWGWTRHEWGDIHYYIAIGLMAVLAIHLLLHWRWIVAVTRGRATETSGQRLALGGVGLLGVILLAAAPLFAPVEQTPRQQLHVEFSSESHQPGEHLVRGEMTLAEIAKATEVPLTTLLEELSLPADTADDERVGRLKRQYGFTMEELRQVVAKKGIQ